MKLLRTLSPLHMALAASIALHATVLTVRFVDPSAYNRVFQDTPLEVVLVNARGDERPQKARRIAQANLAGGGEADTGRATSPLPPSAQARLGDSFEEQEEQIEAMKEQQNRLLAQLRQQLATQPPPDPQHQPATPAERAREQKRQALVQLLAEIEKRVNEENARPRKRFISPATREEVYAIYYDELRRKIEDRGTSQFPEVAGRKLYGALTMVITVNRDGQVLSTEVVQSSGQGVLDRRAEAIVRSLSFGRFNDAMLRHADQIVVVSRFRFMRDETLQTQMGSN